MAPSTTEILFTLGLGEKVIGVTRYCDRPAAARRLPKIGGYVDPNYEAIVSLQPDLVILLTSQDKARAQLGALGITTLTVAHASIEDIRETIGQIGQACGADDRAQELLNRLDERTARVTRAVDGCDRPGVLICIDRDRTSGTLGAMYMAGHDGFYDRIIHLAGGVTACPAQAVAFPQLSAESIIRLNPDVIIDLVSPSSSQPINETDIRRQWDQLQTVRAVQNGHVYVITGDQALRPGPRYIEFLEQLARLLHPDAFVEETSRRGPGLWVVPQPDDAPQPDTTPAE